MFEIRSTGFAVRAVVAAAYLGLLAGCAPSSSSNSTSSPQGTAAPAAPASLKAVAGNAQASLTWTTSDSATSYNVKRARITGGPYSQIAESSSESYTDATVTNGDTYFYVVTAINADGESGNSPESSVTPDPTVSTPSVPMDVAATAGDKNVDLSWAASSGATGYHVKRATSSAGPFTQLAAPTALNYSDTSVSNGTKYYYVVSAFNSAGESANSAQASATPDPSVTPPAVPAGLTATAGSAKVSLSWSASGGASGYHVKRATTSGGPYSQLGAPSTTSYTDTSAASGTKYYYVVSALNSAGESANSAAVSATPLAAASVPAAPSGLSATAGDGTVSLAWTATSGTTSYHVKRATVSGGPYTQAGAPTAAGYTDTSLTDGTTYYYVVSALNSAGEGANSAQVSAKPAAPSAPSGGTPPPPTNPPQSGLPTGANFNFSSAPTMSGVTVIQNRDSVIIQVPAIANARDFRILVQPTAVTANSNGTESVTGGTQFCAGVRQYQARTHFVADNVTLFPYYFFNNAATDSPTNEAPPQFFGDGPPTPWHWADLDTPPMQQIEVTGVTASETVVVEAMDRLCPFPGAIGHVHEDISLSQSQDINNPDNPWINAYGIKSFPVVTKDEVIAKYGSLIINGQGWAGGPNVQANPPTSPPFAQPAPLNPPMVLARAAITISPLASPPAAPATFFDDFSNANDTFQALPQPKWTYARYQGAGEMIMQNSKWTVYGNGYTCCTPTVGLTGVGIADAYIENGALHTTLGDWEQDVLSEVTMVPRKAAHINATSYLHVTYEVNSFATNRRYWVVTLCGSSTAGETLDGSGALKEQVVHSTFFYEPTGMSPSTAGWNCLQIFNRYGNSYAFSQWENMHNILTGARPPMPANKGLYDIADYIYDAIPSIVDPTKTAAYTTHPQSDVVVLVNKPIPKANLPEVGGTNEQVVKSAVTSPVNVSPNQLDNPGGEVAWFFKTDANGNPVSPILDDQQLVSPRTKYDLYIRNNRIIMYVNGKPALCNDFTTPTTTLNMADAAVGFHQVLYHSSGEFKERFIGPDQGGAYHYRYNTPWIDQRTWDNLGFEENVSAPSDFNPNACFVHTSLGAENNEP